MPTTVFDTPKVARPSHLSELRTNVAPAKARRLPSSRLQPQRAAQLRAVADDDASSGSKEDKDDDEIKIPYAGVDTDWREFRARLVRQSAGDAAHSPAPVRSGEEADDAAPSSASSSATWAHVLKEPEKGCLLLAHPLMFTHQQTYFSQAFILITRHDEGGSQGVILNRPTAYKIGQIRGGDALCPDFAECPLYLGGDVGRGITQVMHSHGRLKDVEEIIPGLYLGGVDAATRAVRKEQLDPLSFKWFTSYAGWGPGQLHREIENGVWFCAAADASIMMRHVDHVNTTSLWHDILQIMDGDYRALSDEMQKCEQRRTPDPKVEFLGEEPPEEIQGSGESP
ncbi:hypothetical protein WJX74_001374 [Apatococcus lobatus]|uniref:Uncharacterized protein n=1 Tax=Apatococcus lobatus TaxID=904363 RepID=A0AAW1Q6U2_9CHLO